METLYFGVDLHSTQLHYHSIKKSKNGKITRNQGRIATTDIEKAFLPILTKNSYVCVETSTSTFAFAYMIEKYVKKVLVINPFEFKALYLTGKKTDKVDAKKLANRLKCHIEDQDPQDGFPKVYIPPLNVLELRNLHSSYEFISKQIVSTKNKIRAIFRAKLVNLSEFKYTFFSRFEEILEKSNLDSTDKLRAKLLFSTYKNLSENKSQLRDQIVYLGKKNFSKEIDLLISIKGISDFTACVLMADIGDITRFKNHKHFASYMRCAPKIDASNESCRIGSINKRGRKNSFKYILQGLNYIIEGNPKLKSFYQTKETKKSKGKIRTAIVRKTLVMIFYMLKNGDVCRYNDEDLYKKKQAVIDKIVAKMSKAA